MSDFIPPFVTRAAVPFVLALLSCMFAASPSAQDWNQWRGPSRTGGTAAFKRPSTWPERPKQVWKAQVGTGHASPVVAEGRLYVHSRLGEKETVTAFELASGRQVWQQAYDAPYQMNPAATSHGKGPKSTPVYDRGRLFTFGIGGVLTAWSAKDGRTIWRKDFRADFKSTSPDFGVAMSPAVAGDLLLVHAGGIESGALLALDVATGAVRWSWAGDGPAYASPIVADLAGVRQVITQSKQSIVGVGLADGKRLWQIPFTTDYDQNSVTPVVAGDLLIYSGLNKPTTAVRIRSTAGRMSVEDVWKNADVPMYMSSPVVSGDYLYGLTHRNRGQFFCVDVKTGKTMWTTRGREGENAALTLAGDLLVATTTEGELVIAPASPKGFEPIKRYTIAESPVWAHPAIAPNGVAIKDAETVAYWVF
jgi:outer membrane protein assembly factor BamB